jgi:hypothetical protein
MKQPQPGQRVRIVYPGNPDVDGTEATVIPSDDRDGIKVDVQSYSKPSCWLGPYWGLAFELGKPDYSGAYFTVVAPSPAVTSTMAAFPTDRQARKEMPVARGVLDYFPLALLEVAKVSFKANQQHNPGEPMHWARGKSTDHADCIARHLMERGTEDKDDGLRHSAKLAWRALALLQTELELAQGYDAEAAAKATK